MDIATPSTADWTGHVIVCGLEGVGLRTVEQLHQLDVPVVVIQQDPDARLAAAVVEWGIPHLATGVDDLAGCLRAAGIDGARAVVCTEAGDLRNVETALLVRDLRDDIAIVAHLDNPTVGRALEEATGTGSVLDVAGLFAPSVVEACVGASSHDVPIAGERFVAAEVLAPRSGRLRELYGDLAPVGVVGADDELIVCPGRDHVVVTGDRVTVLGTSEGLQAAGVQRAPTRTQATRGLRRTVRRLSRTLARDADRALLVALALGVLLLTISALVLHFAYRPAGGGHLGLEDSVYFTVSTIATVGFGDFSFSHQSPGLEAYGVALIVAGTTLVTAVFALLTNLLVSRRIEQSLGHGDIHGMDGHVVLVGLGAVGLRVLEGLRARGCDVVVVERDERNRYVAAARALGAPVVHSDATLAQTLDAVSIQRAGAVAILTSDDLVNFETGLAVRDMLGERWRDVPVVLRVFDRALGHRLESSFDFHHVWSTSALAAPWFVGAALGLEVLASFYVQNRPFLVARLRVSAGGGLVGLAMRELSARIRVVAILRHGLRPTLEHPPRRDTRFGAGDEAFLVGPYEELLSVLRRGTRVAA
jgi:Trk K+ transport system NAD-binding subunit